MKKALRPLRYSFFCKRKSLKIFIDEHYVVLYLFRTTFFVEHKLTLCSATMPFQKLFLILIVDAIHQGNWMERIVQIMSELLNFNKRLVNTTRISGTKSI